MFGLLQRMLKAARLKGYSLVYVEQGQFPASMLWSSRHRGPGIGGGCPCEHWLVGWLVELVGSVG